MKLPPALMRLVRTIGSLRLTVYLLGLSVALVFFGTLDQVRIGIREAQILYFESLVVIWRYPEFWPMGDFLKWIPLPLPGGYLLGPLLFFNLLFSHILHFRKSWTFYGIPFIHAGILILLVGQLVTNLFQKEDYMWLDEGAKANFIESFRDDELYISRVRADGTEATYAIPFEDLKEGYAFKPPFPFEVRLTQVFPNAEIQSGNRSGGGQSYGTTRGLAQQFGLTVREVPLNYTADQRPTRTAVVEIVQDDRSVGTWLVSNILGERFDDQTFMLDGEQYALGLRYTKEYLPFTVELLDFQHDRYPGTNIPSNFSSRVRIEHPGKNDPKEVMIFMNNPLRYEGYTFFQASFAKQDTASMFHVVQNPGWMLPYIACILVTIGLLYQFTVVGIRMSKRSKK